MFHAMKLRTFLIISKYIYDMEHRTLFSLINIFGNIENATSIDLHNDVTLKLVELFNSPLLNAIQTEPENITVPVWHNTELTNRALDVIEINIGKTFRYALQCVPDSAMTVSPNVFIQVIDAIDCINDMSMLLKPEVVDLIMLRMNIYIDNISIFCDRDGCLIKSLDGFLFNQHFIDVTHDICKNIMAKVNSDIVYYDLDRVIVVKHDDTLESVSKLVAIDNINISYDEKCIVIPSQSVRYIELDADKKLSRINFF